MALMKAPLILTSDPLHLQDGTLKPNELFELMSINQELYKPAECIRNCFDRQNVIDDYKKFGNSVQLYSAQSSRQKSDLVVALILNLADKNINSYHFSLEDLGLNGERGKQ